KAFRGMLDGPQRGRKNSEKAFSRRVISFVSRHWQLRQPSPESGKPRPADGRSHMARRTGMRRIGIADVAIKAGVSHATVSRVMNGNFTVDPEIAARVRAAAAELNYQPNPVGRSLALGRTDTIGIVVPDLANPTFQGILRGLSMAAAQDGYRVLIADSSEVS